MLRAGRTDVFDYSDGDAVEEEIYRIVSGAHDRRSGSEELAAHVHSWAMEYHFSSNRANLLRPFSWRGLEVLEIGAGCGALTRFLGEQGARVVALEGSLRRARIAAARCAGLAGVRVFCDTLHEFASECKFDVVLAVGVLEYAPAYCPGRDPVAAFLGRARSFVKPAGSLLVAIENQLGLKYFAGVAEDHTGELFYGIQDRYHEQQRYITFGRAELTAKLIEAGFGSVEYLYPFPDYKIPSVVFTHEALTTSQLQPAEMIGRAPSREGGWPRVRLFPEAAAWETVCRNGLAPELANSFLAVASDRPVLQRWLPEGWLAAKYQSGRRWGYRTMTSFLHSPEGMRVERRLLHDDATGASSDLVRLQAPSSATFVTGTSLHRLLARALSNPATTASELCALLAPWVVFLQRGITGGRISAGNALLPGTYLDCVPWNLLSVDGADELTYVGAEWDYLPSLKAELPFVHGMINLALLAEGTTDVNVMRVVPYGEFLAALAERLGLPLSRRDLSAVLETEANWISEVLPVSQREWLERITALMAAPLAPPRTLPRVLAPYQGRVVELLRSAEASASTPRQSDGRELAEGLPHAIARSDHPTAELES
jgi:2-polyprenyl-3-methyl-5-hydroxy-6-metoxy-1,4-benzoquinol methylase